MSIATVVTRGFGSFGSVNLLPTLGYSISTAVIVAGPFCVQAIQGYRGGRTIRARTGGAVALDVRTGGVLSIDVECNRG